MAHVLTQATYRHLSSLLCAVFSMVPGHTQGTARALEVSPSRPFRTQNGHCDDSVSWWA